MSCPTRRCSGRRWRAAAERLYRWTDFSTTVLRVHTWRGSLDAFNDILRGGFGTPDDGFVLVWRDHLTSRERLGPAFDALVDIIRDHGPGGDEAEDEVELVLA